ncbi:MAG: hypothetical protein DI551_07695 [Micavibrio aeruginosavorus]|uniref:MmgE/PrpD family protein n=1 Tax=Micavibrio aeruginosavorus TaxID=349221 RepID=A0A2W5MYS0_9BACT|nr:MAG: hypothetical protein DI551_07695 [Micavibrio aeruginosavorus]
MKISEDFLELARSLPLRVEKDAVDAYMTITDLFCIAGRNKAMIATAAQAALDILPQMREKDFDRADKTAIFIGQQLGSHCVSLAMAAPLH